MAEPEKRPRDEIDFADIAAEISAMEVGEAALPPASAKSASAVAEPKASAPAKLKPAPPKTEPPKPRKAEPAKPKEPSRTWVQLAAAQDKSAFPAGYKRIKAKAVKLLSDKTAWTTPMRATNRLLVGPMTDKEARELVNQLSKLEISSYAWTSEAGQTIEKLPAK